MADTTGRTGSGPWKKLRDKVKRKARARGQTHCPIPGCGVILDWDKGRTPTSAEVDHIIPHSRGGRDVEDNLQVICRRCNQSKGDRIAPKQNAATLLPFVNPRW